MRLILQSRSWYIAGSLILIAVALWLLYSNIFIKQEEYITATVVERTLQEVVAVSGVVEAKNTAKLAFPVSGVVTDVFVTEGDKISAGTVLATLASVQQVARRNEALASLKAAQASYQELLAGPTSEARAVTTQTVTNAEENLEQVKAEQATKVANARTEYLSTDLEALTDDDNVTATPPSVSGSYTCDAEGTYNISVYPSAAQTGYSYNVSGLESGTYTALTENPGTFGDCGLALQFVAGEPYRNSEWKITIPNKNSSLYVSKKNAYDLAQQQASNAIKAAENTLQLAQEEAVLTNADPRNEAVVKARATIEQARAVIANIDAEIADRSIVAPFEGTITGVSILPGEVAPNTAVITLLANDAFELIARVPEIDVTKITDRQSVEMVFDAKSDETLPGNIRFISPLAIEIDGVAYFEATIEFEKIPIWLRSGLNADINIIVAEKKAVPAIPKRFVTTTETDELVLMPTKNGVQTQIITTGFTGNDGYVEVRGLSVGDIIVAP